LKKLIINFKKKPRKERSLKSFFKKWKIASLRVVMLSRKKRRSRLIIKGNSNYSLKRKENTNKSYWMSKIYEKKR